MLMTLFKHEMRATSKIFLWLYIAFAVIAVVNILLSLGAYSLSAEFPTHQVQSVIPDAIKSIVSTLYFLSIVTISIITFIVVILRFYRNLLGDEGYLMMTLPVSREHLILSKLFAAVVWNVCTGVLIFLSVMFLIGSVFSSAEVFKWIIEFINAMAVEGYPIAQWIILCVVLLLIGCFSGALMLYAAMAIGPNLLKNRVGGSILAFIMIYIASQIISTIVMVTVLGGSLGFTGFPFIPAISAASGGYGNYYSGSPTEEIISFFNTAFLSGIICYAVIAIACWFLTRYMLKRKLNLA